MKIDLSKIPWRIVVPVIMGLAGAGGYADYQYATEDHVSTVVSAQSEKQDSKIEENRIAISGIKVKVGSIQDVQHASYARVEARAITKDIEKRLEREAAYDKILLKNRRRLKKGQEPCSKLECE